MNARLLAALAVLVPFLVYTDVVALQHGYLGFLELALREPWGMQMLLDLSISLGLFATFAIPDARERGIHVWPYLVACVFLGSIGALGYLVHREVAAIRRRKLEETAA
jgi:hypothetical protein